MSGAPRPSYPDRLQPRYGIKEVGIVEHRSADGTHDSRLVRVPGVVDVHRIDMPAGRVPAVAT